MKSILPVELIEKSILLIRGQKIMLSKNLAELYGVEHRVLMQAVKRGIPGAVYLFIKKKPELGI